MGNLAISITITGLGVVYRPLQPCYPGHSSHAKDEELESLQEKLLEAISKYDDLKKKVNKIK